MADEIRLTKLQIIPIDSLRKLPPDEDLVIFIGCTADDAAMTFEKETRRAARVVYSFTRRDGKVVHYIPLDGAVPDWGAGVRM